jgi:hypothetical protein
MVIVLIIIGIMGLLVWAFGLGDLKVDISMNEPSFKFFISFLIACCYLGMSYVLMMFTSYESPTAELFSAPFVLPLFVGFIGGGEFGMFLVLLVEALIISLIIRMFYPETIVRRIFNWFGKLY